MSTRVNLSQLKTTRIPLPKKKYKSRIQKIVDIGVQPGYQGGPAFQQLKVTFQCSNVTIKTRDGEQPRTETKYVAVKGGDKAILTQLVDSLHGIDPNDFAFDELVGLPVKFKQDTHEMAPDKLAIRGFEEVDEEIIDKIPPVVGDSFFFSFENPDPVLFAKLSQYDIEDMKKAQNYGGKIKKLIEGGSGSVKGVRIETSAETVEVGDTTDLDGILDDEDELDGVC
jgi:hypothetical protein